MQVRASQSNQSTDLLEKRLLASHSSSLSVKVHGHSAKMEPAKLSTLPLEISPKETAQEVKVSMFRPFLQAHRT
jgi:hypothetical protein